MSVSTADCCRIIFWLKDNFIGTERISVDPRQMWEVEELYVGISCRG